MQERACFQELRYRGSARDLNYRWSHGGSAVARRTRTVKVSGSIPAPVKKLANTETRIFHVLRLKITWCGIELRHRGFVMETANHSYSANAKIALIGYLHDISSRYAAALCRIM